MKKVKYLESIRGIGALMVIIFHFLEFFYQGVLTGDPKQAHLGRGVQWLLYSTPLHLVFNGPAAVTIFFVLSGYVLTFKYFKTKDTQHLTSGAVRRYFRLMPVVLAVELLSYICLRLALYSNASLLPSITLTHTWINAYQAPADLGKVLYEAFIGVFIGSQHQYDVPLWTMTYEFAGSMLVFAAAMISSKMRNRWILYAALVIIFFSSYFDAFVLGMILSDLSQRPDQPLRRWIRPWMNVILGLLGLFLLSFPVYTNFADQTIYAFMHIHSLEDELVIYYYTWGAFLVLLAVLNSPRLQAALSIRPFVYLGKISFPLYAVHYVILGSLSSFLFIEFYPVLGYGPAFLATLAISIPVVFGLSELIKKYVDNPGIRGANWVYQRLFQPTPVVEPEEQPIPVSLPEPVGLLKEVEVELEDPIHEKWVG